MTKRSEKSPIQPTRMMRSKGESCRICKNATVLGGKENDTATAVSCCSCKQVFHLTCHGISTEFYHFFIQTKKIPWYCYYCDVNSKEKLETNVTAIENIEKVAMNVNAAVATISEEIQKMKAGEHAWRQEFQLKMLETVDKKIEEKVAECMSSYVSNPPSMSHPTASMSADRISNSNSYRRNLVISGVPEIQNENVVHIVKSIAKQIHFSQSTFVDNCFRIAKKTEAANKPAVILLKFTTEIARDDFLNCYFSHIKRNKLIPNDIGLNGEDRIYVNEHMDPDLHPLLRKAIEWRKKGYFKQVSSHHSHVSVKTMEGNRLKWHRLHGFGDLDALIDEMTPQMQQD